jgi:hypothetical protein
MTESDGSDGKVSLENPPRGKFPVISSQSVTLSPKCFNPGLDDPGRYDWATDRETDLDND